MLILASGCKLERHPQELGSGGRSSMPTSLECDSDDGGLVLPPGFCATLFADSIGAARHVTVSPTGDVFVAINDAAGGGRRGRRAAVVGLRDRDEDGHADSVVRFGSRGGTGIQWWNGWLYVDEGSRIIRYALPAGALRPVHGPQLVISGLPTSGDHVAHNFVIDDDGRLFVNVGSESNACQQRPAAGSPGADPCPELEDRAGIWLFDAEKLGQPFSHRARFASGLRNALGLAMDPHEDVLYATQHGRDRLSEWPKLFDTLYNAENPAEELVQVRRGDNFGWPYCYFSSAEQKLVTAPEYGGDGKQDRRCRNATAPVAWYPAHWAPMSLLFYTGTLFPARYRDGVFIAFHGSWNRRPLPQAGFRVIFQPLHRGRVTSGRPETFADGFAGQSTDSAKHRPVGLAEGPGGALYITDDRGGRVWRIVHRGER